MITVEPQEVMEKLFDSKILAILKFFITNDDQFYLREIARRTKVSPASTYRILNQLVDLDILGVQEIKTAKLYKLKHNKVTDFLKTLVEVDVVGLFVEKASSLEHVDEILLLGKRSKSKANVLVLGEGIDAAKLKFITGDIKEHYGYSINQMTLSKEQYMQMSDMGLYPGTKKVLYSS